VAALRSYAQKEVNSAGWGWRSSETVFGEDVSHASLRKVFKEVTYLWVRDSTLALCLKWIPLVQSAEYNFRAFYI
jgi:hypothetical protein